MVQKKWVSLIYRTATTAYPCFLPDLGEFSRSWSYMTYPRQKYKKILFPALLCSHSTYLSKFATNQNL